MTEKCQWEAIYCVFYTCVSFIILGHISLQRGSPEVYPTKLPKIKQDPSAFRTELPVTSPPPQARSVPPQPTVIKPRADHVTSRRNRRDSEDPEVINNIQRILQNAKMEMEGSKYMD